MIDPTYIKDKIDANPVWHIAWILSENFNDNAPIGWGKYISVVESINTRYEFIPKEK